MARGRNIQNRQKRTIWRAMPGALALLVLLPVLTVIIGGAGAVTQSEIDALKQEQEESQARQEELKEELSQAEAEQSAAEDKRDLLLDQGLRLAPYGLERMDLELQNIYAALAQPTDRLVITWPVSDSQGNPLRPSFVVERLRSLLPGAEELSEDGSRSYRLTAPVPALETAGSFPGGPLWDYFAGDG